MSEHRKWADRPWREMVIAEMVAEHDKLHTAWQESQAELERIGKINDSMCDTIAELEKQLHESIMAELESRPVLTREECKAKWAKFNSRKSASILNDIAKFLDWLDGRLPAPIRVPFSEAQIEAMAKAADLAYWNAEESTTEADMAVAIRAALAASGLEPCPMPEYAPEDVALSVDCEHDAWRRIEPGLGTEIDPLVDAYLRGYMEVTGKSKYSISYSRVGLSYVRDVAIAEWRDRLARVSAKSNRRIDALKACVKKWKAKAQETPKGLPTADELWKSLTDVFKAIEGDDEQYIEVGQSEVGSLKLALRPFLREPTGWDLDVTAELAARMLQDMKASYCEKTSYSTWDQLGENYKEDFIKVFERFLPSLASRIRPKFAATGWESITLDEYRDMRDAMTRGGDWNEQIKAEYDWLRSRKFECKECAARREAMMNPAPDVKCAMCAEWEKDCRALSTASRSIDARIAACAAGAWRFDVENAPKLEWLAVWYAEHPRDWFKARLGLEGWETPLFKPTKTPDAFAVPNPPQVTT